MTVVVLMAVIRMMVDMLAVMRVLRKMGVTATTSMAVVMMMIPRMKTTMMITYVRTYVLTCEDGNG